MMKKSEDNLREIGRIGKPHGICGEVKVIPQFDDPDQLRNVKSVFVGSDLDAVQEFEVSSIRSHVSKRGLTFLLTVVEIHDRDIVNGLRGLKLFVRESELPLQENDEFSYRDIVGFIAVNEQGEKLGIVSAIIDRPPQDLLVLATGENEEVMIPIVDEFVKSVDSENRNIVVSVIEGML